MAVWRNIIFGLVLAALLCCAGFFAAINSAGAMSFIVRTVIEKAVKSTQVKDMHFSSLVYVFPSSWKIRGVRARGIYERQEAAVSAGQVDIKDVFNLLVPGRSVQVVLSGAEGSYGALKVAGVGVNAVFRRSSGGVSGLGDITAEQVSWDKFSASALSASFSVDIGETHFNDLLADVYGGKVKAAVRLMTAGTPAYEVKAVLSNVDIAQLDRAIGGAFHELGGTLSGGIRLKGAGLQINALEASLNMPSGGKVSAALLASIASYLPSSVEKKRIESLIQSGGKLAVEVFSFTINNDAPDHLSGAISLKSREANLELNIEHEVTVDSRIDALLRAWSAVFKE